MLHTPSSNTEYDSKYVICVPKCHTQKPQLTIEKSKSIIQGKDYCYMNITTTKLI